MNWNTDSRRYSGGDPATRRGESPDWGGRIVGDDQPFDPLPLLDFEHVTLWGSNHFGCRLPVGATLVWVKRNDRAFGSFLSDAELAFEKGGHGVYCFRDVSMNAAGANFPKHHPTQKPVALMEWCVLRHSTAGLVVDPYMGSGTTGVACERLGLPFVGIECNEQYFEAACERISAEHTQRRLAI